MPLPNMLSPQQVAGLTASSRVRTVRCGSPSKAPIKSGGSPRPESLQNFWLLLPAANPMRLRRVRTVRCGSPGKTVLEQDRTEITTAGVVTEHRRSYRLTVRPMTSQPGRTARFWFTEFNGNKNSANYDCGCDHRIHCPNVQQPALRYHDGTGRRTHGSSNLIPAISCNSRRQLGFADYGPGRATVLSELRRGRMAVCRTRCW